MDDQMEECVDECLSCYAVCSETMTDCMDMGGEHAKTAHLTLLEDCAKACQLAADFMLRSSENHAEACRLCAEMCERCAKDCDTFEEEFMKECAEQCRACAEACRAMSP